MRRFLFFGVIVLVLAGMVACSMSSSSTTTVTKHVYVVGALGSAYNNHVPVIWKDGAYAATLPNTGRGYATGIVEDKSGTLYISGDTNGVPGYWKATATAITWNALTDTATNPYAFAIALDTAGNVYVLGTDVVLGVTHLVIWTNSGNPALVDAAYNYGGDIQGDLSGNVYGADANGAGPVPLYFKGPTPGGGLLTMVAGSTHGAALGVAVDASGNVYISGSQFGGAITGPAYWKSNGSGGFGAPTALNQGSFSNIDWDTKAAAIDSNGNLGVVAGWGTAAYPQQPVYWTKANTNGAPVGMTLPTGYDTFNWLNPNCAAFDANNNFIVVGEVGLTADWVSGTGSQLTDAAPVVWTNATPTLLPENGNAWGTAQAVVVGP